MNQPTKQVGGLLLLHTCQMRHSIVHVKYKKDGAENGNFPSCDLMSNVPLCIHHKFPTQPPLFIYIYIIFEVSNLLKLETDEIANQGSPFI